MKNIGERIKEARLARGLSQNDLAIRSGYGSRASINKIELGKVDPPRSKVEAIADALHVSPAWILGFGEDDEFLIGEHPVYKFIARMSDEQKDRLLEYAEFILKKDGNK